MGRPKTLTDEELKARRREYAKRYYQKNREKVLEYQKAHAKKRREADPDGVRAAERERQYKWRQADGSREKYLAGLKQRRDRKVAVAREYVRELKEASPCMDCGQKFPFMCMDFDHVSDDKQYSVGSLVGSGASLDLLKKEIAKCELVCANCHRVRTHTRLLCEGIEDTLGGM